MGIISGQGQEQEPHVDLAALAASDAEIDPVVVGIGQYNMEELSDITGWSIAQLNDLWLWSGTAPAAYGERVFSETDAAGLKGLKAIAEQEGLDFDEVGTFVRSVSYSMERLALTQVESIVQRLARRYGVSDTEARMIAASYAPSQSKAIALQIAVLWQRHFAGAIHRLTTETILLRGVSDEDHQFPLVVGVGYARVVDFTARTAGFGVESYARFVQTFNNHAADIINSSGGRVVKIMGDIVVWVTPHAHTSADIALRLAALDQTGFDGQLQVAVTWCRVMTLHGDLFGPGVNLAARLVEVAPAGEVLIDDAAASQFVRDPRYTITPQPELEIKGLGLVRPWILKAAPGAPTFEEQTD